MLRSKNFVSQTVSGVQFVTDVRNGTIQFASIGGEDMPKIDVYGTKKLLDLVVWVLCVVGRAFGVFGMKSNNSANDEVAGVLDKHVKIACASLGMLGVRKNYNPDFFIQDCVSACWLDLHKFNPAKADLATWVFWRCRLQKVRYFRQRQRGNREKDLDILIKSVRNEELAGDSDEHVRTMEFRSFQDLRNCLLKDSNERCGSVDHEVRIDKLKEKLGQKDFDVLKMYFLERLTLKDIGIKTSMTSMGVQKRLVRLINGLRPKDQPILSLGGRKQRLKLMDMNIREFPAVEEGVLRVVDNPPSGYRHNGRTVFVPDRPTERMQQSLSASISPNFADYVRKVKGNGFVMLVAD